MPKPIRGAENAEIRCRIGAKSGAAFRRNHLPLSTEIRCRFAPIFALIVPIGSWVLREACSQARAWLDAGLTLGGMAVNVSSLQFQHENFAENVFAIADEAGLDLRSLELELTESVLMKLTASTIPTLERLRARGVRLAIDDFGTGYSSLSYLRRFPIDALKIDQSFVRAITTAPAETALVTAVIAMGRSLKLQVIAEGVETLEELDFLRGNRCDEAQGYYFSRPVPAEEFAGC